MGCKPPQPHFPVSVLRRTPRVLCFRCLPILLRWSVAPPIPPATGRGFRVKADQIPSLAPPRALGPQGLSDGSWVQPAAPERGLRQGRYRTRRSDQPHWTSGGGASLKASDRCSPHSLCQMRAAAGRFLNQGSANGGGEVGGSGVPGGGSSAPSRGAGSRWGDGEASAEAWVCEQGVSCSKMHSDAAAVSE